MMTNSVLFDDRESKPRLLCVDDNARHLTLFTALLEESGCSVYATDDPRDAFAVATFNWPDLVLLDCEMPSINGTDLARKIKQLRPDLPIVLYAGVPPLADKQDRVSDDIALKSDSSLLVLLQIVNSVLNSSVGYASSDTKQAAMVPGTC
jgi:CheY-like chemotaxis protein